MTLVKCRMNCLNKTNGECGWGMIVIEEVEEVGETTVSRFACCQGWVEP